MSLNLKRQLKLYKHHLTNENYSGFWEINGQNRQELSLKYEIASLDYIRFLNNKPKRFKHDRYIKCKTCQKIVNKNNIYKSIKSWCKPCTFLWRKNHYENGYKEQAIKLSMKWIKQNKRKYRKINNRYHKNRRKNDIMFKLKQNLRSRVKSLFKTKNWEKNKNFKEYIGTTPEKLKIYLEKQFTTKMTWQNMGIYWHLDHIVPIGMAKTKEEVYRLSHYTNYQPLSIKKHKKKTKNDIKKIRKQKIINKVNIS